ncbi:MAG: peptidoglycan recognition family protein [Cyanophyceae cyanobacterium]
MVRIRATIWLFVLSLAAVVLTALIYSSWNWRSQTSQTEVVLEEPVIVEDSPSPEVLSQAGLAPQPSENMQRCLASVRSWSSAFAPPRETAPADSTNYGQRFLKDIDNNPITYPLLVVLHETTNSANSAINTFQTPHTSDSKQVSYHDLIRRDGTVVHIVPLEMRAFGAGNSAFEGKDGTETVKTNAALPPSVNNFAYHISFESPPGAGKAATHSGYTQAQYQSLAWLIARTCTPEWRITTHKEIDRSGSRSDPRSYEPERLLFWLEQYPNWRIVNQEDSVTTTGAAQ